MPVRLEIIHALNDADKQDIVKLCNDITKTHHDLLDYATIEKRLNEGDWLFAGRFNDRLIGALIAHPVDDIVELDNAGVRTITQNRGVMHQMIHFIQRWADDEQKSLVVRNAPEYLKEPLINRGFEVVNDDLFFNNNA